MKRSRKSERPEMTPVAAPKADDETAGLILRIEELEPRLTPQSSTSILD
jgi:hypothetical protein